MGHHALNPEHLALTRREFLCRCGMGMGAVSLASLLGSVNPLNAEPSHAAGFINPLSPKQPQFPGKAKRIIHIFANGGPSHVDTFDPKPSLDKYHGKAIPLQLRTERKTGAAYKSPFKFKKYGQSGIEVSDLFPNIGGLVDEIAFVRSLYGQSNDHVQATYEMQMGQTRMGFPSLGSWVTYGLGSENASLPAYVVIHDARGGPLGGVSDWSSGFIPAAYQGTLFRSTGDPIVDLKPPSGVSPEQQRARLDLLAKLNELDMQQYPGNTDLAARISSYELAYRMQGCAPEALDIGRESEATRKLYGLDEKVTEPFGRQCLMARRLVEHGVRFVQLFHGGMGNQNVDTWDAHGDVKSNHTQHAAESDRPIAGLLTDLKARGLLESTLVLWHGEFGRMPISQRGVGRDHNPGAMTIWMAGAGIKGGQAIGASDEFGYKAEQQPISCHDLHATILHLLGIDHTKLTYRFNGRDMRLTDVYGVPIPQIVA